MKTKYLLMFVVLLGISSFTFAQLSTAIPDAVFEQELVDQLIDSDGLVNGTVLTADISGVISLDVSNAANASGIGIDDLTGITAFVALQTLNCSDNDLTALDVTGLGALTTY